MQSTSNGQDFESEKKIGNLKQHGFEINYD